MKKERQDWADKLAKLEVKKPWTFNEARLADLFRKVASKRDAQWKRAARALRRLHEEEGGGSSGLNGYSRAALLAIEDLLEAMKGAKS